jgi:mRNA interferase RelE/StbE
MLAIRAKARPGIEQKMSGKLMRIEFKPRAVKDLDALDRLAARRVLEKIRGLENNLAGDVKRLTNFTPEYRLRVGDYRVLFEIEGDRVII